MRIIDYKIVRSVRHSDVAIDVRALMADGWVPHGSPLTVNGDILQAVVKVEGDPLEASRAYFAEASKKLDEFMEAMRTECRDMNTVTEVVENPDCDDCPDMDEAIARERALRETVREYAATLDAEAARVTLEEFGRDYAEHAARIRHTVARQLRRRVADTNPRGETP